MRTPLLFTLITLIFFGLTIGLLLYSFLAGAPYYFEAGVTTAFGIITFGISVMISAFHRTINAFTELLTQLRENDLAQQSMHTPITTMKVNEEDMKKQLDSMPEENPLRPILESAYKEIRDAKKELPIDEIPVDVLKEMYDEAMTEEDYIRAGAISGEIKHRESKI